MGWASPLPHPAHPWACQWLGWPHCPRPQQVQSASALFLPCHPPSWPKGHGLPILPGEGPESSHLSSPSLPSTRLFCVRALLWPAPTLRTILQLLRLPAERVCSLCSEALPKCRLMGDGDVLVCRGTSLPSRSFDVGGGAGFAQTVRVRGFPAARCAAKSLRASGSVGLFKLLGRSGWGWGPERLCWAGPLSRGSLALTLDFLLFVAGNVGFALAAPRPGGRTGRRAGAGAVVEVF